MPEWEYRSLHGDFLGYQGFGPDEFSAPCIKLQLTRSATQTPKVVISSSVLLSSGDVAVDSEGDLWVPDAGNNAVVQFKKSQLARSGSPAPAITIVGPATGLNWPWAVAIEP